jgi:hypothetical protein
MKNRYIVAAVMLAGLSACTTKLDPKDRAILTETRNMVEKSMAQSANAMAEARAARESAERAAMEAKTASTKADRIFREAQKK